MLCVGTCDIVKFKSAWPYYTGTIAVSGIVAMSNGNIYNIGSLTVPASPAGVFSPIGRIHLSSTLTAGLVDVAWSDSPSTMPVSSFRRIHIGPSAGDILERVDGLYEYVPSSSVTRYLNVRVTSGTGGSIYIVSGACNINGCRISYG